MKCVAVLSVVCVALSLAACAKVGLGHHGSSYAKQAAMIPPIVVPKGVSTVKEQSFYTIPNVSLSTGEAHPNLLPPDSHIAEYRYQLHHKHARS